MELTFLGTGTSQGVPMIGCPCAVCRSADPRDRRQRTSALIRRGDMAIVIDAGPDFRQQMLSAGVRRLDAILLTHEHKDHTGGLDDVRAFNYFSQAPVDVYATAQVAAAVRRDYAYAFAENPYPGAPEMRLHLFSDEPFRVRGHRDDAWPANFPADLSTPRTASTGEAEVVPILGHHSPDPLTGLPVTGFRIGKLAYLTDFNYISDDELEKLYGLEVLVINALGRRPHPSHFNLEQAVEVSHRVGARLTYLTHISHRMGFYADEQPTLPADVFLAYDGLSVAISD